MINFDSLTLNLFLNENKDFFIGAKIQKIQQPSRNELIFSVRKMGESKKFYINFNPEFYHLCFMSENTEKRRNISIPKTAPMFCMLLRKYIQNAKIVDVKVPKYERIFEFYFEYYDELNEKTLLCLAVELMGKYSNVILYNYDTNVIIGCAHNVSSQKSRERELYGSLPYVYPLKQKKKNLLNSDFDTFKENIKDLPSKYYYLVNSMVEDFFNHYQDEQLYLKLCEYLSQKKYKAYIKKDYSKYCLYDFGNNFEVSSINEMIDEYFSYHQQNIMIKSIKAKIDKFINTQLKKLYTLKIKQENQIAKLDKAVTYKNKADILMANLYYLSSGQKKVKLNDFDGKEIEIALDENMSIKENANGYYALYKKTKSAYEHAQIMIQETLSQILYYEEQKYFVSNSDNIDYLKDIFDELKGDSTLKEQVYEKIDFIEYKGIKIYIGKNKKQNDFILSKIASSEDIWFHLLNAPGAHVLIKKNNSKDIISNDIILKAAKITKEYSSQKDNSKTSVIYTLRKYVKKANNKLAFVTYKNESEIVV